MKKKDLKKENRHLNMVLGEAIYTIDLLEEQLIKLEARLTWEQMRKA